MSIQLLMPEVVNALILPNPTDINSTIRIQVTVSEKLVTLDEEKLYSGEVYSGEV